MRVLKEIVAGRAGRAVRKALGWIRSTRLHIRFSLLREYYDDYRRYIRYSSTVTWHDKRSLEGVIIRLYNALEGSLAMPQKEGMRGVQTARQLAQLLDQQLDRFGESRYARVANDVLWTFTENLKERKVQDAALAEAVSRLRNRFSDVSIPSGESGAQVLCRADVERDARGDFEALVHSRHSVRTYDPGPVDDTVIHRAVTMALRCPSACNRQPAKVYDLRSPAVRLKVLAVQNNATGWRNDPDRLLLVTADTRLYRGGRERTAAYIDGSLFAMTLVYALHSLGLGTCCLNLNLTTASTRDLRMAIGASEAEVPIVLVAAGLMKEKFVVPVSARRHVAELLCQV